MLTVDAHLHLNFNGINLKSLIKWLDKEKVDCCWLLSWEEIEPGYWPYKHLSIEDIWDAYTRYPSRIIPFYAPDPHKTDAVRQLEDLSAKGLRGCGELKATLSWDSAGIKSILQTAQRLRLPILFHMEEHECRNIPYSEAIYDKIIYYGLKTDNKIYRIPRKLIQMLVNKFHPLRKRTRSYIFPGYMLDFASLEMALRDYPGVNLIAHGPMFWNHISSNGLNCDEATGRCRAQNEGIIWRLLRNYPNLYADISGLSGFNALTRDTEIAKNFLSLFEDKILYGTDNLKLKQKNFLDSLGLSKSCYRKIFGDNACRILNMV